MFFGCIITLIVFAADIQRVIGEPPNFRVLAPEFVCPNDEEAVVEKADNTIISHVSVEYLLCQVPPAPDTQDLHLTWTVRWTHLDHPSQRFTLLLWRTVRDLEAKLNGPQPEPFVFVIDNLELLKGVEYIFNVTGSLPSDPDAESMVTKTFHIDNIKGDQKLTIEGRSDKFSVLLIGGETVYADMKYVMEAQVTMCHPVQDYYFMWTVRSASANPVNVSDIRGSRLELPRYSLQAGASYFVNCVVYRSSGDFVTQASISPLSHMVDSNDAAKGIACLLSRYLFSHHLKTSRLLRSGNRAAGNEYHSVAVRMMSVEAKRFYVLMNTIYTGLPFQVLYRGLTVDLNFDVLAVIANSAFEVIAVVNNHDFYGEIPEIQWSCSHENEPCKDFESISSEVLTFPSGLPDLGRYEITLELTIQDQSTSANATIEIVEPTLPVIQIQPLPRMVNEHSTITLTANASNVAPSCILTWYFANEEYLEFQSNDTSTCEDCQHGEPLSGSVTITSLEESFLNELTDFSNETEWHQVTAEVEASAGRARFVAQCGCSLTFSCETQGVVHGDIHFELNKSPIVSYFKVSPETGSAMETVFRLSTLAASDSDKPLRYTFYCSLGNNDTLILGSYLEFLAVETFLPYIGAAGTNTWVEVCDSIGACSSSDVVTVQLLPGEGRTVDALVDNLRGHVDRCEAMMITRVVESTVTTYKNTNNEELLSKFTQAMLEILPKPEVYDCIKKSLTYNELIDWLNKEGVDINS